MTILFSLIFALSLLYCLFVHFLCMEKKAVLRISKIYYFSSLCGAVLTLASLITYYVRSCFIDSEGVRGVISTVFGVYMAPASVIAALILAISLFFHFARRRLAVILPYLCHLAAIFILLWTMIYSSWSFYEEFEITLYIDLCGIGLALMLLFPSFLSFKRFSEKFDDREFMKIRKYGDQRKLEKKKEKEHIRETKARLKEKTKR